MWLEHWNLVRDPFPSSGGPYVATPGHDEAVARLTHAIRSGERFLSLRGESGVGKSTVLKRALALARTPGLRIVTVADPVSPDPIADGLARRLGVRARPGDPWGSLLDAVRLIRAQGRRIVVAIDGVDPLAGSDDRHLARLVRLDPIVTAILVSSNDAEEPAGDPDTIVLDPLTRGETAGYLQAHLAQARCDRPAFSARGLTLLHSLTAGLPRRINRLAGLALRAGALDRLDSLGPDVVELAALATGKGGHTGKGGQEPFLRLRS